MPKKKVAPVAEAEEAQVTPEPEVSLETVPVEGPVEAAVDTPAPGAEPADSPDDQVLEARNGFKLMRFGNEYTVKDDLGNSIMPLTPDKAVAEQMFRNMSRKF